MTVLHPSFWTAIVTCVIALSFDVAPAHSADASLDRLDSAQCYQVRAGNSVQFKGHRLLETPDIPEPELRRANALLSAQCFEDAIGIWEDFSRRNPSNFRVVFLKARFRWIVQGVTSARVMIDAVLRAHPDFASAKVLLATMYIDDGDFSSATKLLDDVERAQPEDLWAFIDRLRIEAAVAAEPSTLDTLLAILRDPDFPNTARQQALHIIQYETKGLPEAERDRVFAAAVDDSSVMSDCAFSMKAAEFIEVRNDPRAAELVIQRYLGHTKPCEIGSSTRVRMYLAEAYLVEAAQIAPRSVPPNEALISKAKDALYGDLTPVAMHIASNPGMTMLIPFVRGFVASDAVDEYGSSALCAAVRADNPSTVEDAAADSREI